MQSIFVFCEVDLLGQKIIARSRNFGHFAYNHQIFMRFYWHFYGGWKTVVHVLYITAFT